MSVCNGKSTYHSWKTVSSTIKIVQSLMLQRNDWWYFEFESMESKKEEHFLTLVFRPFLTNMWF